MANKRIKPTTVPLWAQRGSLILSLSGLAISTYLAVEHFTTPKLLACPETGIVNCQRVTESPQSAVLGVPVALWGLLFFAAMTALTLPSRWRDRRQWVKQSQVGAATAGALFVVYLVGVELFVVDAICLWCTAVHAVAIGLFGVIVLGVTAPSGKPASRSRSR